MWTAEDRKAFDKGYDLGRREFKEGKQFTDCPFDSRSFGAMGWECGYEIEISLKEAEQLSPEQIMAASQNSSGSMSSAGHTPMATEENQTPYPQHTDKQDRQQPLHCGMNRRGSGCNEISLTKLHGHLRNGGKRHKQMRGNGLSIELSSSAEKGLIGRTLGFHRHLSHARFANRETPSSRTLRIKTMHLVRLMILQAPLPLLRLVARICPNCVPRFSLVIKDQAKKKSSSERHRLYRCKSYLGDMKSRKGSS